MTEAVTRVLDRLKGVKRLGKGWVALCPAHEDGTPSLKVDEGDDGSALLFCHAGCPTENVVGAIGLTASDLFAEPRTNGHANGNGGRRSVAAYTWADAEGRPLAIHERFETLHAGQWKKEMPWRRPGGQTGLGGLRLPPYRLPDMRRAIEFGDVLVLVEGEKAAESLIAHGYSATTTGSTTSWRHDHAEHFRGARVVIWPDADRPGEKYAQAAASDLLGVVKELRVLRWREKPSGWDAADFWAEGGTEGQLDQMLADAPPWAPAHEELVQEEPPPERKLYRLISDVEAETIAPPVWGIDDIYPDGGLVVVFGQRGKGKTFLVLGWSFCHGTGLPWFAKTVKRGPVVYVLAEGRGGLGNRVRAQKEHLRMNGPANVHFVTTAVPMLNDTEVDRLIATIETLGAPPSAIVWDTLSRTFIGGDENSSKDMATYVAAIDRVKETVGGTAIVQHHTGHGSVERERGSSVLGGAADTIVALKDDGGLQMTCEKQKDAPEFAPIHLELHKVDAAGSCVLRVRDSSRGSLTSTEVKALRSFHDCFQPDGASATRWKAVADLAESSFWRAVRTLENRHLVAKKGDNHRAPYVITPEGVACLHFQILP